MGARDFRDRLRRRAAAANLPITAELESSLESFYRLLAKWNAKINLTAFELSPEGDDSSIDRLLIEPLVAVRHLPAKAQRWLDAGSGGGSPAIPMKLADPALTLHLVEAKTRKAAFLREAVRTLRLERTEVETSRFEMLLTRPELHESLDIVTIRAVRLDAATMTTLQAFLKRGGRLLHFRGSDRTVVDGIAPPMELIETHALLKSNQSRLAIFRKIRT
jgi:16S rRNA (guanine527-N7)-methyltransferase